ncbi:porin [Polycladidibacter stylochi]|uniref:porin n=1 Tax=Polycladidibacter stylochi TaxID=1807766 RepID=UPI00082CAD80|nr:porin [Pseudovibrio stylochi]
MNAKIIAMAAAAAAAATSAQAADLPTAAEPVDYVQACDAFGAGFFKMPGKDTCIKVHGRIRAEVKSGDLVDPTESKVDRARPMKTSYYVKGYVKLTSMTDTEIGMIKTYSEIVTKFDQDSASEVTAGDAYVQFSTGAGDFQIGKLGSKFDGFTGAAAAGAVGRNWSDTGTLQASYAADLGYGLTAAVSVEDSSYRKGAENTVDGVANVKFTQGWGYVRAAGALHAYEDEVEVPGTVDKEGEDAKNKYGFAAAGTVGVNLDMIGLAGGEVTFQAAYAKSATSYLGYDSSNEIDKNETKGFNVSGGVKLPVTEEVTIAADGSFLKLSDKNDKDTKRFAVDGSIAYSPVSDLVIALDGGFAKTSVTPKGGKTGDTKEAKAKVRVQYSF